MSYLLTDEQREIRDLVRQLARERIAPRAAEIDESHEFPWDIVELYREHGLFGLFFDEAYGGLGTGVLLVLIVIEEVSKVCATSGVILAVQELGSLGLKLAGNDEQKQRYLPRLASGEFLAAYALTEAGSGSDSAAMRSTARRDGDDYVLNGSKRFITNAGVASLYTVFAKTDPDAGHSGISAFVVEADTPGFEVTRLEPKLGITGSTTGELAFEDVRVPAANLLGEEGDGFKIAMRILDRSRPGIGAQGLGIAQGATDYALEYAKNRETMGKPIAEHQLIAGEARRHGDRVRGRARAALQVRRDGRPGRRRRRADEGVRAGEALLHRHGDVGDDRGRADPRRLRLHQGVPRRADDARREDHADLRGHERDPAPGDRARDAEGEPGVPARGRHVKLSSADRVLFPDDGVTKGDLFEYYGEVAPAIVPHLKDRPFTLKRQPHGINEQAYFQKQAPKGIPDWIPTRQFTTHPREGGSRLVDFVLVNSREALLWMVQMNCIDMNAWYSRVDKPERPDYVVFDLDPPDDGFANAIKVAHLVHEALEELDLRSYVKTSGASGIHVLVPITRRSSFDETYEFAELVSRGVEERNPGLATTEWLKKKRPKGSVLVDHRQNGHGKTIASAYSVRPRPGAPVSTPLRWEELTAKVRPRDFGMREALERIEQHGDLYEPVLRGGQSLGPALRSLR